MNRDACHQHLRGRRGLLRVVWRYLERARALTAAASWSKERAIASTSLPSECHRPHSVVGAVERRLHFFASTHARAARCATGRVAARNRLTVLILRHELDVPPFVSGQLCVARVGDLEGKRERAIIPTSRETGLRDDAHLKIHAMVVAGSMPPSDHAYVPPRPISVSATDGPVFLSDETGPIAPAILNSRDVSTSNVPAKPMTRWPPSTGVSSGCFWKTRRKLSLNTDCVAP